MKHALALILACCALVAQNKPDSDDPGEILRRAALGIDQPNRQPINKSKPDSDDPGAILRRAAQDKASVPNPIDLFDLIEEAKNGKVAQDGRALSKSAEHGLLIVQLNSLADSIKLNDELAKRLLSAAGTKGISFEAANALTKSYVDTSMLALEQRKLWMHTLSKIMDLSK